MARIPTLYDKRYVCYAQKYTIRVIGRTNQLPTSLAEWRSPEGYEEGENAIWQTIQDFLRTRGYTLWRHLGLTAYAPPHDLEPTCNGFAYAPIHLGWGPEGRVRNLSRIDCMVRMTNHGSGFFLIMLCRTD